MNFDNYCHTDSPLFKCQSIYYGVGANKEIILINYFHRMGFLCRHFVLKPRLLIFTPVQDGRRNNKNANTVI